MEPAAMSKLRRLVIKDGTSHYQSLQALLDNPRLTELEYLSLSGVRDINDASVTQIIKTLPKLQVLDLSRTDITGVGVKQALTSKHLEQLVLDDCSHIGFDAIEWARTQGIRVQHRMSDAASGGRKVRY